MCAPKRYLDSLSDKSEYHHRFSYEKIAAWFGTQPGPRASWRQHVMKEAIEQGRRGYTMEVNAANTAFHLAYWEHLQRHHHRFQMARPKKRGSNSTWIIFQGHNFPKGVKIHHKLDQQVMEIGFPKRKIEDILAIQPDWPDDIALVQKGGTASLAPGISSARLFLGPILGRDTG